MSRRRRLPNFLRASEQTELLAAAESAVANARGPRRQLAARRNWLLVLTGLYCGLRVSEMVKLSAEDLDLDQAVLQVRCGKGDKDRAVPIPGKLLVPLREWMAGRQGHVFPGPAGRPLSTRAVELFVAALGRAAGLTKKVKPHSLRHTYATRLLERGANIREVQELLGHASVATTETYTHVAPERLRGAVERL